jgi:tRNA (pseudouridine54-N1)-methyltransferase
VQVHLVLTDEFTIRFDGREIRRLNPDERSTAALIRDALAARDGAIGAMAANPVPGVYIRRGGFKQTIERVGAESTLFELHENGEPVANITPSEDPAFVLSDHREFTETEANLLSAHADHRVRVGPERLHADHTITVAHNWLDTDGYTSY